MANTVSVMNKLLKYKKKNTVPFWTQSTNGGPRKLVSLVGVDGSILDLFLG